LPGQFILAAENKKGATMRSAFEANGEKENSAGELA